MIVTIGGCKKIIVIDWESTDYHSNFNDAFFTATGLEDYEFSSFSQALSGARLPSSTLWNDKGRFRRFVRVFRYCLSNRKSKILFITYDSLFAPFVSLFCNRMFVFEHNTTPEHGKFSKHVLWQKLTFGKIFRLAQYRQQLQRLVELNQRCAYLGSPLKRNSPHRNTAENDSILIGSRRFTYSEAKRLTDQIKDVKFLVRKLTVLDSHLLKHKNEFDLAFYDWLSDDELRRRVLSIYVNLDTEVRGSGWFNDSISFNVPLILYSSHTKQLFKENFPNHKYIDLCADDISKTDFNSPMLPASEYEASLQAHNDGIKARLACILGD